MRIAIFVGTRPEIIKMASIVKEGRRRPRIDLLFVHTGQHYDWEMSARFVSELGLPEPDEFLNVGSAAHAFQTARIINRTERFLRRHAVDLVLVEGDTNSALGVALSAAKCRIKTGHVEAGCRSFDRSMPEELNRLVISDCVDIHFAPTKNTASNLLREGIEPARIFLTGHPLVKLMKEVAPSVEKSTILRKLDVEARKYAVLTVHREENVTDKVKLRNILKAARQIRHTTVFPAHPRTEKMIRKFDLQGLTEGMTCLDPIGYADMLKLIECARFVMTDSGGIQQEAAIMGTPCITLRRNTEWIETLSPNGSNFLAGCEEDKIIKAIALAEQGLLNHRQSRCFGDGNAPSRILDICLHQRNLDSSSIANQLEAGTPMLRLISVRRSIGKNQLRNAAPLVNLVFDSRGNPVQLQTIDRLNKGYNVVILAPKPTLGYLARKVTSSEKLNDG